MAFAGRPPDVLYEPFRRRFRTYRFLSHLHSLMVTMSQKSSVPQAVKSVSQALMSDNPPALERVFTAEMRSKLLADLRCDIWARIAAVQNMKHPHCQCCRFS